MLRLDLGDPLPVIVQPIGVIGHKLFQRSHYVIVRRDEDLERRERGSRDPQEDAAENRSDRADRQNLLGFHGFTFLMMALDTIADVGEVYPSG